MSFSSTPLGQGRRLDHSTFLGKNQHHHRSAPKIITSPPRSPEKFKDTTVNVATAFTQAVLQSETMNPNDSWASGASASYRHIPRSTSVDYEKETQNTSSRRLAAPPRRNFAPPRTTKPLSKSGSVNSNVAPDSEQEDEHARLENRSYQRGKSPLIEAVNGLYNKSVSFVMRARGTEADNTPNGHQEDTSYSYEQEQAQYEASQPTSTARKSAIHRRRTMSVDNKAYKPSQSDLEQSDSDFEDDDGRRRRRKSKKGGPSGGPLTSLPVTQYDKRKRRRSKGGKADGTEGGEESADDDIEEQRSQSHSVHRTSVPPQAVGDDSIDFAEQGLQSIPEDDEDIVHSSKESELLSPGLLSPQSHSDSSYVRSRSKTPPSKYRSSSSFSIGAMLGHMVRWLSSLFLGFFYFSGKIIGMVLKPILPSSHNGLGRYILIGLVLCLAWYSALLPASLRRYIPAWSSSNNTIALPTAPPADFAEISARLQAMEAAYVKLSNSQDQFRSDLKSEIRSRDELGGDLKKFWGDIGRVGTDLGKLKSQIGTLDGRVGTMDGSVGTLSVQIGSLGGDLSKLGRQIGSLSGQLSTLEGRVESDRASKGNGPSADAGEVAAIRKDMMSFSERLRAMADIVGQLESMRHDADSTQDHRKADQRIIEELRSQLRTFDERLGSVESSVKESLDIGHQHQNSDTSWWSKLPGSKTGSTLTIKTADGQDVSSLLSELVSSIVIGYFARDILGKPDYALYSAGARVLPSFTSQAYEIGPITLRGSIVGLLTGSGYAVGRPPVTALHPEIHNGHCWPFAGTQGRLGVALSSPVVIDEIVIEHVPKEVAYDLRSAPREMEVWGLVEGIDNLKRFAAWKEEQRHQRDVEGQLLDPDPYPDLPFNPPFTRLAKFSYDVHAFNHIQTFPVLPEVKEMGIDFGVVVLMVKSNWGMDDYTCLYRMRVHGQRIIQAPPLYGEEPPTSES